MKTRPLRLRLTDEDIARVNAIAAEHNKGRPGAPLSQAAALAMLVVEALDARAKQEGA